MLSSIEKAINRIWHAPVTRSLFNRIASYWLVITLGPVLAAVVLGFATSFNFPLQSLLPSGTGMIALGTVVFFAVYKWVPNARVSSAHAWIAAALASVAWNCARIAYTAYTKKILTYSKIYGSLSAIPLLLLWIYIVWIIVLAGAALTAALQKKLKLEIPVP
jgi:membrane protein